MRRSTPSASIDSKKILGGPWRAANATRRANSAASSASGAVSGEAGSCACSRPATRVKATPRIATRTAARRKARPAGRALMPRSGSEAGGGLARVRLRGDLHGHRHIADPQLVPVAERDGLRQLDAVDEGAVLRAEVLEGGEPHVDEHARVTPRHALRVDPHERVVAPA